MRRSVSRLSAVARPYVGLVTLAVTLAAAGCGSSKSASPSGAGGSDASARGGGAGRDGAGGSGGDAGGGGGSRGGTSGSAGDGGIGGAATGGSGAIATGGDSGDAGPGGSSGDDAGAPVGPPPGPPPGSGTMTNTPCGMANGAMYIERYRSANTRWCVNPVIWAGHADDVKKFFAYGDFVINQLSALFAVTPKNLPYTIQVEEVNGGAHTLSDFGDGVGVTGDAYYNDLDGVKGFWGYLLTLHELINDWTGLVTDNWPVDWWADHRSPFPNSMDYQIMLASGQQLNDATLTAAADVQHKRLGVQGQGDFDPEVKMFDDYFAQYGGFPTYARVFKTLQADGIQWAGLGENANPSPLLTEYVIAYLSLGFRTKTDLTNTFVTAGVGSLDDSIAKYSVDAQAVGDIADAHCAIAAAGGNSAGLAALRKGNYKGVTVTGTCGAACPAECGCDQAANRCVALWRAK